MTPEAASERIAELNSDKEWGAKFLAGISLSDARAIGCLRSPPACSRAHSRMLISTPEQAKARLEELNTDSAWRRKFLDGDLAIRKEFDRLTEIAAQVPEGTAAASKKALTAAEARAAALEAVPDSPKDYGELPFRRDDMPTPEGITEIQGLMHTAGLTKREAQTMILVCSKRCRELAVVGYARRELHVADSLERFNRMHGADAPAMLEGARRLVAEITAKDG